MRTSSIDVGRGALGALPRVVERGEQLLRRSSDLAEPLLVQAVDGVAEREWGPIAGRGERYG